MQTLQELKLLKQQYKEKVENCLKQEFIQFLNKHNQINSIEWVQYTPYFNDGDECVFGVTGPYFYNIDHASGFTHEEGCVYNEMVYDARYGEKKLSHQETQFIDDAKNLRELIHGISEDMKHVFGDHCKVVVMRSGITITIALNWENLTQFSQFSRTSIGENTYVLYVKERAKIYDGIIYKNGNFFRSPIPSKSEELLKQQLEKIVFCDVQGKKK